MKTLDTLHHLAEAAHSHCLLDSLQGGFQVVEWKATLDYNSRCQPLKSTANLVNANNVRIGQLQYAGAATMPFSYKAIRGEGY